MNNNYAMYLMLFQYKHKKKNLKRKQFSNYSSFFSNLYKLEF